METWLDEEEKMLGPLILAKEALEPDGRWTEVRAQLVEQTAAANQGENQHDVHAACFLLAMSYFVFQQEPRWDHNRTLHF